MITLVDCNNFYVSCERAFDPSLICKPVVVLSNNDGCAVARSQEAKDMGVRMAQPWFEVMAQFPDNAIIARSSNYALYGDMSRRVINTLQRFSPGINIYSIDEAFLSTDHVPLARLVEHARSIRVAVGRETGIPVSTGTAPTMTLAKIAGFIAKKGDIRERVLYAPDDIDATLSTIVPSDIWGVGSATSQKLEERGIHNGLALKNCDLKWIRCKMGITVARTVLELRGYRSIEFDTPPPSRRHIVRSRSFGVPVTSLDDIREAVTMHAGNAAEKLRAMDLTTSSVGVFIATSRFRRDLPKYSNSISRSLEMPTEDSTVIIASAVELLRTIYRSGFRYKKAGVILQQLQRRVPRLPMDGELHSVKMKGLMDTVDTINRQMGRETVTFGTPVRDRKWQMRREMRSHRYTTRWKELPVAKIN